MIIRRGMYLAFVLFMAYESVIYENAVVSMMFVAAIILPVISFVLLLIEWSKIAVTMKIPVPVAEKDNPIQLQIVIKRSIPLPVGQIDLRMRCISGFTKQERIRYLSIDHDGKINSKVIYDICSYQCGKVKIVIDRIRMKDIFGLCSLNKKINLAKEITFLPKIYETMVEVSEGVRHFAGETEEDEPEAAGNDHSQVYQIRPYRPGDRLQTIHWKLTARSGELYVREAGEPICLAAGIFMDFRAASAMERSNAEALIESALSISNALLEQNCRHFIVWYDVNAKKLSKQRISKMEDIYALMSCLMSVSCYGIAVDLKEMYKEVFPYGLYAADITLKLSGEILAGEELTGHFDAQRVRKSMADCFIRI